MLAVTFKHAAVIAMNFNRLMFVMQTARVFCEVAVDFNELLIIK
jgi:hypothetical protein